MMCYIHWFSATRRLKEVEKTVTMLAEDKYSERGVPEMVLAQRDFIKKEVEYFADECATMAIILFGVFVMSIACYVFYFQMTKG